MILYVDNFCKIHPLEDLVYAGSGSVIKKKKKKKIDTFMSPIAIV